MIAVVTDSTACLPDDLLARHRVRVVPLHLLVDGESRVEGVDMNAAQVAAALRQNQRVSTSKPSVGDFLDAYADLVAEGAEQILSIHLSGEMSGTVGSARTAAEETAVPVEVLDSRSLGMGLGFAVISAAQAAQTGASVTTAAAVARRRADAGTTTFYVDTLDYLRRGGRIGRASALVGSALSIKPLLTVRDGAVEPVEKVRTASKALARLEDRTAEHAGSVDGPVDVAVQHLDAGDRAESLRDRLQERLGSDVTVRLVGLGAVIAAHVGPGTIGTVVSPRVRTSPPTIGAASMGS